MSPGKQRAILLAILGVAVVVAVRDATRSEVTVTAQDGTEVVIRLDPEELAAERAQAGYPPAGAMREYGVSEKPPMDLPSGRGNEANLSGTKAER